MAGNSCGDYKDPKLPVEARVRDLLEKMTLDEKLREMNMFQSKPFIREGKFCPSLADELFKGAGIGAVQDPRLDPGENASIINDLQNYLKSKTRLGIPAIIISECLHGFLSPKATVFPQVIGYSSSWDTELIREIASVIAEECRANGVTQGLAPNLDLAREPRWGRVEETYGEDPFLCSRMGAEYVKGLQGEDGRPAAGHIVATVKHFAAHGSPEGGVNLSPVSTGERQLRELYLKPFRAAVVEAGALSVMPAYSEIDGIPCSSSRKLLTRILRDEWGFKGYTFSDYGAIAMFTHFHKTASTPEMSGIQALKAGMDLEAPECFGYSDGLRELVKNGTVPEELIDRAVSNILRVKFLAGLFDEDIYACPKKALETTNCEKHKKLALKAAQESIVLLKNSDGLLPLDRNIKSLAVIGPNAAIAQFGDYTHPKAVGVTSLEGIKSRASAGTEIIYAKGCNYHGADREGFREALQAAERAEAVVIFAGDCGKVTFGVGWGREEDTGATCGEGYDRSELDLSGVQLDLIKEVVKTGKPVTVVLINGRPLSIPWISENAGAVLEAWYPGEEGGNAIADVIFGNVNPSGRLTVSIPKSVGQTPVFYNHKPSARGFYHKPGSPDKPGMDYVFSDTLPLYEFGYGLSYTTFEYSGLEVYPEKVRYTDNITVSVLVRNTGCREGKEVVQLYINDLYSSVSTPVRELRGFKKILLKPGEVQKVSFALNPRDLAIIDEDMNEVVEPGTFEVMVGGMKENFEVFTTVPSKANYQL